MHVPKHPFFSGWVTWQDARQFCRFEAVLPSMFCLAVLPFSPNVWSSCVFISPIKRDWAFCRDACPRPIFIMTSFLFQKPLTVKKHLIVKWWNLQVSNKEVKPRNADLLPENPRHWATKMRPFAKTPKIDGKKDCQRGNAPRTSLFLIAVYHCFSSVSRLFENCKNCCLRNWFLSVWANSSQFYVKRARFPGGTVVCLDGLFWYLPSACLPFGFRPPPSPRTAGGGWGVHKKPSKQTFVSLFPI